MGRLGYFTNNSHAVLSGARTLEASAPASSYSISIVYGVRGRLEALDSAGNVIYTGTFYTLQPVSVGTYEMQFTDSGLAWDVSGLYVCVNIQVDDTGAGNWSDNRWCWTFTEDQGVVLDGGTVYVWVEKVDDPVLGQYYNVRYGGTYNSRYDMIYSYPVSAIFTAGRASGSSLESIGVSATFTTGREYAKLAYARLDRSASAGLDYTSLSVNAGYSVGRTATARLDYVSQSARYYAGRASSARLTTWFLSSQYTVGGQAVIPEKAFSTTGRASRLMSFLVEVLKNAGFAIQGQAVVPEKSRAVAGSGARLAEVLLELYRSAQYALGRQAQASLDAVLMAALFTVSRISSVETSREFGAVGRASRAVIAELLLEQLFEVVSRADRLAQLDTRVFDFYVECFADRRSRVWGGRRTGCGRLV